MTTRHYADVAIRMGNGTKIHPAVATITEIPRYGQILKSYTHLEVICSCPNSQNGHYRATVVSEGHELVNCGGRG